jgi:hypothetical protein
MQACVLRTCVCMSVLCFSITSPTCLSMLEQRVDSVPRGLQSVRWRTLRTCELKSTTGDVFISSAVSNHDRRIPIPGFDAYGKGTCQSAPTARLREVRKCFL